MTKEQVKQEISSKPSYFKKGKQWLADKFEVSINIIEQVFVELKDVKREYSNVMTTGLSKKAQMLDFLDKIKERNPGLKLESKKTKVNNKKLVPFTGGDINNVLVIGDLHEPWTLEGYLEFNLELQKKYNCGTVVFIGDLVDGHSWSFHTHNVDGMSVKDELTLAIEKLKRWYEVFPIATVLYGNHDLLISRKAKEYGLSQLFIKHLGDILEAPKTWKFVNELYKDGVLYIHGSIGNAITRAKNIRHSVVQGHLHSQSFVEWSVSEIDAIFGLQVGCGIDRDLYAFEYAKDMPKKPIISSGIVLEKGTLPIIQLMKL